MAKEDLASQLNRSGRAARDEQEGKRWHRDYYHRYFEGWTEYTELTDSGRVRIKRVYTAEYYSPKLSESRWRLYKLLYLLAVMVSFALFAVFAGASIASNSSKLVVAPQVLSLFAYIFTLWFELERLFTPVKMTVRQYNEAAKNLKTASLVLSLCLAAAAAASGIHYLFASGGLHEAASVLAFALAGGIMFFVFWNERRIEYVRVRNENAGVDGSVM